MDNLDNWFLVLKQQMLMIMKMQQEQAKSRMPLTPGGQHPPRGMLNPGEAQRIPGSQQGNMPVMINLQGHGGVPPSPDKPRGMPLMVNPQVGHTIWMFGIFIYHIYCYRLVNVLCLLNLSVWTNEFPCLYK